MHEALCSELARLSGATFTADDDNEAAEQIDYELYTIMCEELIRCTKLGFFVGSTDGNDDDDDDEFSSFHVWEHADVRLRQKCRQVYCDDRPPRIVYLRVARQLVEDLATEGFEALVEELGNEVYISIRRKPKSSTQQQQQ